MCPSGLLTNGRLTHGSPPRITPVPMRLGQSEGNQILSLPGFGWHNTGGAGFHARLKSGERNDRAEKIAQSATVWPRSRQGNRCPGCHSALRQRLGRSGRRRRSHKSTGRSPRRPLGGCRLQFKRTRRWRIWERACDYLCGVLSCLLPVVELQESESNDHQNDRSGDTEYRAAAETCAQHFKQGRCHSSYRAD
jgi:hypothetical protein